MSTTVKGNIVSTDGGKLQLRCLVSYTASAVKFKPYIVVTKDFSHTHDCVVSWTLPNGKKRSYTRQGIKTTGTAYVPNKNWQSNSDYSVTVKAVINGSTSTVTLTSTIKPGKPTLSVKKQNDNHYTLTVKGKKKGSAIQTSSLTIQRQDAIAAASWETIRTITVNSAEKYSYTLHDQNTERGNKYRWRVRAENPAGNSGWVISSWKYTTPPDISDVAHTRVDNAVNDVSWKRNYQDVDRELITGFVVQRSESGGAWINVASNVSPGDPGDDTVHWMDKSCSADNYYSYRVKPRNRDGISRIEYPSETGTEPTYNTPNKPGEVTAEYTSRGTVLLRITNKSKTADQLQIQRKCDDGPWTDIEVVEQSEGLIEEYEDETGITGENVQYRLRNGRSSMAAGERWSSWIESGVVDALQKPNRPTLISPLENAVVMLDAESVRLSWVHNPNDGTAQELATLQYKVSTDEEWTEETLTGAAAYYDMAITAFGANDTILWRVSTKGAHEEASDFCEEGSFVLYAKPEIVFTSPENGTEISNLPLVLGWDYSDASGTMAQMKLNIICDEEIIRVIDIPIEGGETGTYSYSLSEFLFENETDYQLEVVVLSSTGLETTDQIGVHIDYIPVHLTNGLFPDVEMDEETGYALITISADESIAGESDPDADEPVEVESPVASAYLYRVVNGERVLLTQVEEGDQVTDRYCPLNVDFRYELFMVAESGQVSFLQVNFNLQSSYWFVYWNDEIARAIWNPSGDIAMKRPEKTQVRYSGRKYPVSYDSLAMEETYNFSAVILDRAELNQFRKMMRDGGQGIWKSCDGDVYAADFSFSFSADYTKNVQQWNCTLSVTRIDSEEL